MLAKPENEKRYTHWIHYLDVTCFVRGVLIFSFSPNLACARTLYFQSKRKRERDSLRLYRKQHTRTEHNTTSVLVVAIAAPHGPYQISNRYIMYGWLKKHQENWENSTAAWNAIGNVKSEYQTEKHFEIEDSCMWKAKRTKSATCKAIGVAIGISLVFDHVKITRIQYIHLSDDTHSLTQTHSIYTHTYL